MPSMFFSIVRVCPIVGKISVRFRMRYFWIRIRFRLSFRLKAPMMVILLNNRMRRKQLKILYGNFLPELKWQKKKKKKKSRLFASTDISQLKSNL